MAYQDIYRMQWVNTEGIDMILHISDTTTFTIDPPVFHDLIPVSCQLAVVNTDENKFSPIRGKKLTVSFLSTATYSLKTFINGADDRWYVELFVTNTSNPIFYGYLIADDLRENFLPPETYTVELTASDNLAILGEVMLTKTDGTIPKGKFTLIQYIAWALQKTNLQLAIKAAYNLFEESYSGASDDPFSTLYLDAKTFEAGINERVSCLEVLTHILNGCFLTQDNGSWWIVRVDEMNPSDYTYYTFSYTGTFLSTATLSKKKDIGKNETIKLINKDAEVTPERKVKFTRETYNYDFPREIIDNIDFSRGTNWLSPLVVDMSLFIRSYATTGAFPATGEYDLTYLATGSGLYYKWSGAAYVNITGAEIPTGRAYEWEDWTLHRIGGGTNAANAYIAKITQFGDEKARYGVITTSSTSAQHYISSNPIPLGRWDKFTISFDRRLNVNRSGSGTATEFVLQLKLNGEDGSVWTAGNDNKWVLSSTQVITHQYNINTTDETQWMSISADMDPVPVNGDLTISLYQSSFFATVQTHFSNLQFDYVPYINGSYQKYTGQSNKVSITDNLRANVDDQIYVSDAPKKLFKGCLFKLVSGQYVRAEMFYNYLAGTTGELGIARYSKYLVFELWNQKRRIIRKFQGSLLGLDSSTITEIPGLLHLFTFTASTEHTDNKYYMLLSYSQDLVSCKWTGVFADVYDTVDAKDYADDYEFRYEGGMP
jgi:hypothetical protein